MDWGHLYLAVPREGLVSDVIAEVEPVRSGFAAGGKLPDRDDLQCPRPACDGWPAMACVLDFGRVSAAPVSRYLMLAYDDVFSVEYMDRRLRPYWRRAGCGPAEVLLGAARRRKSLAAKCRAFDAALMADLRKAGGGKYAELCALAYRQCVAAHKLAADFDGSPMHFSKENFSNGCISTVDVIYPARRSSCSSTPVCCARS